MPRIPWLAVCAVLALLGACAPMAPEAPPVPAGSAAAPVYRIGPGDKLDVNVWRNETLSMEISVRPDGLISFPLLGDVTAAGRAPLELAQELERGLANLIRDPNVIINVTEVVGRAAEQVRMMGEVHTPRAIPFRRHMTLVDALVQVEGLTEFADGNGTILIRQEGNVRRRYRVRVDDLLHEGDVTADIELAPGDVLIVPESFF